MKIRTCYKKHVLSCIYVPFFLINYQKRCANRNHTSQRCIKCGRINKDNRNHHLHLYVCDRCGYKSNDDRIAAMNIQLLGTEYVSGNQHPKFITD